VKKSSSRSRMRSMFTLSCVRSAFLSAAGGTPRGGGWTGRGAGSGRRRRTVKHRGARRPRNAKRGGERGRAPENENLHTCPANACTFVHAHTCDMCMLHVPHMCKPSEQSPLNPPPLSSSFLLCQRHTLHHEQHLLTAASIQLEIIR
jgi:hypothetical protein